jgi:hypothetical protein
MKSIFTDVIKLVRFYYEGFRDMSAWGSKVWVVIIIKLFIIFAILRLFFLHDFLHDKYDNDKQRGNYVLEQLTNSANTND